MNPYILETFLEGNRGKQCKREIRFVAYHIDQPVFYVVLVLRSVQIGDHRHSKLFFKYIQLSSLVPVPLGVVIGNRCFLLCSPCRREGGHGPHRTTFLVLSLLSFFRMCTMSCHSRAFNGAVHLRKASWQAIQLDVCVLGVVCFCCMLYVLMES